MWCLTTNTTTLFHLLRSLAFGRKAWKLSLSRDLDIQRLSQVPENRHWMSSETLVGILPDLQFSSQRIGYFALMQCLEHRRVLGNKEGVRQEIKKNRNYLLIQPPPPCDYIQSYKNLQFGVWLEISSWCIFIKSNRSVEENPVWKQVSSQAETISH